MESMPDPPVEPPPTSRPVPPTVQVDPVPVTVTLARIEERIDLGAALAVERAAVADGERSRPAKMPIPVTPATVTDEPDPETTMVLATRRSSIVLQRAAVHHRERAAVDQDALAKAVHGERAAV